MQEWGKGAGGDLLQTVYTDFTYLKRASVQSVTHRALCLLSLRPVWQGVLYVNKSTLTLGGGEIRACKVGK